MRLIRYTRHKDHRHFFGLLAEYIAIMSYLCRFYTILAHRYKSKVGEVDFIATRGNKIIFIEVKARKTGMVEGIVSEKQQRRVRRTAELYLLRHRQYSNYEIRFDLVVVNKIGWLSRIKNAF